MNKYLDNFHQGGKYSAQIDSHQAELRREEKITDQKSLNISSLQTDNLNIDRSSGFVGDSEIAHDVQKKCTFFGCKNHSAEKCFKRIRKEKENLARLMLWKTDKWNVCLRNALDVDLKIK